MNEKAKNNYWGVLPANVRYDKRISASAKQIYSVLTALTHKNRYWMKIQTVDILGEVIDNIVDSYLQKIGLNKIPILFLFIS